MSQLKVMVMENQTPEENPSPENITEPTPLEAPSETSTAAETGQGSSETTEGSAVEMESNVPEEIDLNPLFPEEETDLNALFPEQDMRVLLKKIQRSKKDLVRMQDRFIAAGEEIEDRLEDPEPETTS